MKKVLINAGTDELTFEAPLSGPDENSQEQIAFSPTSHAQTYEDEFLRNRATDARSNSEASSVIYETGTMK